VRACVASVRVCVLRERACCENVCVCVLQEHACMLWVQGESDGVEAAPARAYGDNLRAFVAAARKDFARHNAK
jgi:hypothetical protein